jgi:ribokinase
MIVVFGSINLDLVARVARLPRPGETIAGASFATLPGGKGANQALAARRAGAQVALAGAVGTDVFAPMALAGLVSAGVDLAWVRRVEAPTGVALIHVDAQGENAITVVPGANAHAAAAPIPDASLGSGTTLVMQLEVPLAAVGEAAARARKCGARIMLNAAPAQELPAATLSTLDILVVNEHEAATLAGGLGVPATPEDFATAIHRHFECCAIVTLGADGALALAEDRLLHAAALAVDAVDTTGAGDAFTGALAAALDRGAAWPRALAEGVAAGSLACLRPGAQSALPAAAAISELARSIEPRVVARIRTGRRPQPRRH